jgi:hypothetical protein
MMRWFLILVLASLLLVRAEAEAIKKPDPQSPQLQNVLRNLRPQPVDPCCSPPLEKRIERRTGLLLPRALPQQPKPALNQWNMGLLDIRR